MNPKKMQSMMKQLGMAQEEIDAERVIIEKKDGRIIIDNPNIIKINMQGQTNFQISGNIIEEAEGENKEEMENLEEDIKTIVEKTGCNVDEAAIELEKCNGDIAQTIINLSK